MIDRDQHDGQFPAGKDDEQQFNRLKAQLHERLVGSLNLSLVRTVDPQWLRDELRRGADELQAFRAFEPSRPRADDR